MAQFVRNVREYINRRKFLRTGVPFIIFVAGGSFFLKHFTSIRYEFRQGRQLTKEEAEHIGLKFKDPKTVEKEFVKEMEQLDVDNWENIRGPRPWEDSKTVQNEQREKLKKKHSEDKSQHL